MFDHQRSAARVTSVVPWGVLVVLEDGTAGLVDNAKLPAWRNGAPLPRPGDTFPVVVLDATRDPVRVSALPEDALVADGLRPLPGGLVNEVVRSGSTVRRWPGERAAYVHDLLRWFARRGWSGAPRYLGMDDDGREVLGFVPGEAALTDARQREVRAPEALAAVVRLVRAFHDLTAGTPLSEGGDVVCHNDLSPRNTVYAPGTSRPVALIDWDLAGPGERVHDVAHLCWQFLGLGPGVRDVPGAARAVRAVCEAYGEVGGRALTAADVVGNVLWWQERCARGIEAGADGGDAAMVRLRERGVPDEVRAAHAWVARHRRALS
ncbi:phosphotransferase [Streptomyces avicenniae]|uniref:phosphotransferase n=1 Tax=Streptomyces avicenniae TaxID=500153 RepID=UPI000A4B5F28|nr:phosphotransferase [Streptomyces avicenniae]